MQVAHPLRLTSMFGFAAALTISVATAQESRSPFDAATIQFPATTSIVRTGDFNGDALPDGVGFYYTTTSETSVRISVFFGAGDGTFTPGGVNPNVPVNGANTPWALEVGSFNGDGRDDYAVAFYAGGGLSTVRVYQSDSNGHPQQVAAWTETFPVYSMAVADFDLDGLDDIAVAGVGVKLYRNTGAGFALQSSVGFGSDIRVGEFDDVPGPDLFVMDGVYLVILPAAGGNLTQGALHVHGFLPSQLPHPVAGDIDGDQDDDIVVFSDAGQAVVMRRTAPNAFTVEPPVVGGPATDLVDIDGDGDLDGACCGGGGPSPGHNLMPSTFRVSLNDGAGNFAQSHELVGFGAFRLAGAVDVDQDGDRDLVAGRVVFFNRGGFAFDPQPAATSLEDDRILDVVDFDGDGDPDLRFNGSDWLNGVRTWTNDGRGGFSFEFKSFPKPDGTHLVGASYEGDFDGDGDDDVIAYHWATSSSFIGMRLYKNAGGGHYEDGGLCTHAGPFIDVGSSMFNDGPGRSVVADLDQDGDLDIVAGRVIGLNASEVWWNNGAGFFVKGPTLLFSNAPVAVVDLDGDGVLDVVGGGLTVFYGLGAGQFASSAQLGVTVNGHTDLIALEDFDGDGSLDIAAWHGSGSGDTVKVLLQKSPRAFQVNSLDIDSPFYLGSLDDRRLFADDFDQDGDADLLVTPILDDYLRGRIFLNDGAGNFSDPIDQIVGHPRAYVDVDGDGDRDLISDRIVRNAAVGFSTAGLRRQYGESKSGLGGAKPTLGAVGPFAAGNLIELRITGGRGGTVALFMVGFAEAVKKNWPAFGVTAYTFPAPVAVLVNLDGGDGEAGAGDLSLKLVVPAPASGLPFYHQAFLYDVNATPGTFSYTNGLELRYP